MAAAQYRERALALLTLAIADAVRELDADWLAHVPLFLGTPETGRPGSVSAEVVALVLARLREEHGLRFDAQRSRAFSTGNTGGLRALAEARALLERHPHLPGCLVAGVDSLVNAPTLGWLNRQGRLKRPDNSDGVIPGEAAACVFVSRRPLGQALLGLGFAWEEATLESELPLRGTGMSQASRAALTEAGLDISGIDFRVADASGEGYAFKEVALAAARLLRVRKEAMPLWLPAESLGETGAASAAVALVLAMAGLRRGYAPGPRALIHAASGAGDRAAAVLFAPTIGRRSKP